MLTEGRARQAFLLLDETGLLREVLPEIEAMKGVEQPPQFHPEGDVFVHTLLLLDKLPHPCSVTLAWSHLAAFYQIEGLAVDEGLTMADLRGAIQSFVDALFGAGLRTRLRPDYFPFTEPSADVSMECHACRGASAKAGADPCRTCRSSG